MWRFIVVTGSILLVATAPAAADDVPEPRDADCIACTNPAPPSLPFHGIDVHGLPAPSGEFITGDAHHWDVVEDTDPLRAEFDDRAVTVIQRHEEDVHYAPRALRGDVHVTLRQRTFERPHLHDPHLHRAAPRRVADLPMLRLHHGEEPTILPARTPADGDETVIRIHGDDVETSQAPDDGDETVIRIHGDEAEIDGEPVELTQQGARDEPADAVDEDEEEIDDEPPELITNYVEWEFIPVVEVLEATGGVTPVDAQRMLERDVDAIADCFQPQGYDADGAVDVDLYLAHTGRPHSVNGSTDGVRPTHARCILQRAWGYEFPRPAERADDPGRVRSRVEFVGQTIDAPTVDPLRPQFLLERLSLEDHPELEEAAARSMVPHLDDAESCAVQSLEALPEEFVVTEVHARWTRSEGHHYRPTDLDITVSNETSTERPPPRVVECYRRALRQWNFDVADADVAVRDLPETLRGSFFVTLRPAGW